MVKVPKTWAVHEIVNASDMNAELRDQILATAPQKAVNLGDVFYATGEREIARLAAPSALSYLTSSGGAPSWQPHGAGSAGRVSVKMTHTNSNWAYDIGTPVVLSGYDTTNNIQLGASALDAGTISNELVPLGVTTERATNDNPTVPVVRDGVSIAAYSSLPNLSVGDNLYLYRGGTGDTNYRWYWAAPNLPTGTNVPSGVPRVYNDDHVLQPAVWHRVGIVIDVVSEPNKQYAVRWAFESGIDYTNASYAAPNLIGYADLATGYTTAEAWVDVYNSATNQAGLVVANNQLWLFTLYRAQNINSGSGSRTSQEEQARFKIASSTIIPTSLMTSLENVGSTDTLQSEVLGSQAWRVSAPPHSEPNNDAPSSFLSGQSIRDSNGWVGESASSRTNSIGVFVSRRSSNGRLVVAMNDTTGLYDNWHMNVYRV